MGLGRVGVGWVGCLSGGFLCSVAKVLYFIFPLLVLVASVKLLYFAVELGIPG